MKKYFLIIFTFIGLNLNPVYAKQKVFMAYEYKNSKEFCKAVKANVLSDSFDVSVYCQHVSWGKVTVNSYIIDNLNPRGLEGICSPETDRLRTKESLKLSTVEECLKVAKAIHYSKADHKMISKVVNGVIDVLIDRYEKNKDPKTVEAFREIVYFYDRGEAWRRQTLLHPVMRKRLSHDFQNAMIEASPKRFNISLNHSQPFPSLKVCRAAKKRLRTYYTLSEACKRVLNEAASEVASKE